MSSSGRVDVEAALNTITSSSLAELEQYLQAGGSANLQSSTAISLLHKAVKEKDEEKVELLLHHSCDVNVVDDDGLRPVNVAIKAGATHILARLLQAGADVNYVTESYGQTNPLIQAVGSGDLDMISLIVDMGEKSDVNFVNDKGKYSGQCALSQAIMLRDTEMCQYLLNCGASYKVVSESRYVNLSQRAVYTICKHDALMNLFLNNDVDLNLNYHLTNACKYGNVSVAELLLTKMDDPFHAEAVGLIARQGTDEVWERIVKFVVKPYCLATRCCKENILLPAVLSFCELKPSPQRQTLRSRAILLIRVLVRYGLVIDEQTSIRDCHSECHCRKAIFIALRECNSVMSLKFQCCSVIRQNMYSHNSKFDLNNVEDLPLPRPFKEIISMKEW